MMKKLIDKLAEQHSLEPAQWMELLSGWSSEDVSYAGEKARQVTDRVFGRSIYFRGIIEFTNYCKNDCIYCGLRRSAKTAVRYRLTEEQILESCQEGYALGFRTFVLQGGEDGYYTDERLCNIIKSIKRQYPDCAVTMSVGERSRESYEKMFNAGADRYLLRHETASKAHYEKLHPAEMSFDHRMSCLKELKAIGYQTGCGMMVGTPWQTAAELTEDMLFISSFKPHMIGIGPFCPHHDTPFKDEAPGSVELTLLLISLCRLMQPEVLLPSTTALDCGSDTGRMRGILAGANVIMPNLSPLSVRKKYLLYDNKPGLTLNPEENLNLLKQQAESLGYKMVIAKGDYKKEV